MSIVKLLQSKKKKLQRFYNNMRLRSINLRKGDIAIDCGANVGKVSSVLARHGATVYAFEPNPVAFDALRAHFDGVENVHCINKGVYTEDSTMKMYLHEKSSEDPLGWSEGGSLIESKTNIDTDNYIEIEVIDLCRFIENLDGNVKVVKIDIEGGEIEVVPKLIETGVINSIGSVFVETHDDKNPQLREKTEQIREMIRNNCLKNIDLNWT